MKSVYVVQHSQQNANGDVDVKLIGVFDSSEDADSALSQIKLQSGFRSSPDTFSIDIYEINKIHWTEGFGEI